MSKPRPKKIRLKSAVVPLARTLKVRLGFASLDELAAYLIARAWARRHRQSFPPAPQSDAERN